MTSSTNHVSSLASSTTRKDGRKALCFDASPTVRCKHTLVLDIFKAGLCKNSSSPRNLRELEHSRPLPYGNHFELSAKKTYLIVVRNLCICVVQKCALWPLSWVEASKRCSPICSCTFWYLIRRAARRQTTRPISREKKGVRLTSEITSLCRLGVRHGVMRRSEDASHEAPPSMHEEPGSPQKRGAVSIRKWTVIPTSHGATSPFPKLKTKSMFHRRHLRRRSEPCPPRG